MPIFSLNLALSNRCTAKCVFCPATRGTKHHYDMPFDLVRKIVDEVKSPGSPFQVQKMELGENGEALLNKEFLDICRYLRAELPGVYLNLTNNFSLMTPKTSQAILKEGLLDAIQVNVDGHDAESYAAMKKLNYNVVVRNLKAFFFYRKAYRPNFNILINVMPVSEYVVTVESLFKRGPVNMAEGELVPTSSFEQTVASLKSWVPPGVPFNHSSPGLWAERQIMPEVDLTQYSCPILHRVENECFVAPNGDWYPCCLDDNNDQPLGNLNQMTLVEIHESERRQTFIQRLKERRFQEIGYPCNTVYCCQTVEGGSCNGRV